MSCDTCGHTMQAMGCKVTDRPFFLCPRCGTTKPCDDTPACMPDLVRRCREFEKVIARCPPIIAFEWNRTGVREAINLPENRP